MAPKRRSAKEPTRLRVNVAIDADLRRRLGAYVGRAPMQPRRTWWNAPWNAS